MKTEKKKGVEPEVEVKETEHTPVQEPKEEPVEPMNEKVSIPVEKSVAKEPSEISMRDSVKIKPSATKTFTGLDIPKFAYRNTYRISKILKGRAILHAGNFKIAVKVSDIEKA